MGWITTLALYFVIWWTVIFAVLPFGMRTQEEEGDVVLGTTHSAPHRFSFRWVAFWTSIAAALIVGAFRFSTEVLGLGLDSFPHVIPGT